MSPSRSCRILLVEDNPAEVHLLREAFKEFNNRVELHTVSTGEEALNFMHRRDRHADKPRPDIILLDINLPKVNGHEVLRSLKNEPNFRRIPMLMLSGSNAVKDVRSAYDNHANAYLQKPSNLEDYFHLISELNRFWLRVVQLPA